MKRLQLIGPGMTDIRLGHELDELNVRFPPLANAPLSERFRAVATLERISTSMNRGGIPKGLKV